MTELEHLDDLDRRLSVVFDIAVETRDKAQETLEQVISVKRQLIERRMEVLRGEMVTEGK
jgi:hypothetical protein